MKQCDNGHFYDEARFDSCPYCQENAGIGKTMAAGSIGKTVAVMPGSGPMEADLGMNYAIVLMVQTQKSAGASSAKESGAAAGNPKAAKKRGAEEKKAVLRGVTGKYAGQTFDLLKDKVILGRDPALCNIVFDKNTPGISGRHCQLPYNETEGCFVLTDLGSSYGTFLGNGKKLAAQVPEKLSAGDTFYLCDTANRFVVAKE